MLPLKYPEQVALPVSMPTPADVRTFRVTPTVISVRSAGPPDPIHPTQVYRTKGGLSCPDRWGKLRKRASETHMRERYTLKRRGVSLFNETIRHIRISVAPAAPNIPPNIWNVAVEEVRRSLQAPSGGTRADACCRWLPFSTG
jgi:hypothetical protein